jgi:hypothetical protein
MESVGSLEILVNIYYTGRRRITDNNISSQGRKNIKPHIEAAV